VSNNLDVHIARCHNIYVVGRLEPLNFGVRQDAHCLDKHN